jgi:propanol-preferring alcohol dehydrogenase
MLAARLHDYCKPLQLDEVPRPEPGPRQVVVRVMGAGFCHSDLHVIDGEIRILPKLPVTLGHENAGIVAAVGAGVTTVREGDPVAVFGGWGDGRCDYCVGGEEHLCVAPQWVGLSMWDGGYAEYLLVPHERYLVKLSTLDPKQAAPLVDAALTPYRAVKRALPYLVPGSKVLLTGVGGLGQFGIKLLRLLTGCDIIAIDVSDAKLATAVALGATHVINGRGARVAEEIADLTGGAGVCAAFDFVGSDQTLALSAGAVRTMGKVVQIGLAGGTARLKVLENVRFEVAFEVSLWGSIRELREVLALAESGRLTPIDTEYAPLEQINDVYARVKRGDVEGRIVMTP